MPEPRALIVDWGGVLTGDLRVAVQRWAEIDGVDEIIGRAIVAQADGLCSVGAHGQALLAGGGYDALSGPRQGGLGRTAKGGPAAVLSFAADTSNSLSLLWAQAQSRSRLKRL